jgi:NAD-dependent DNA ligase
VVSSEKRGELFEKKVCITGSFEGYSRDALVQVLEEQG